MSPKVTDGVWKQVCDDEKLAATFVQSHPGRCSVQHPAGAPRHLPQQAGEGVYAAI